MLLISKTHRNNISVKINLSSKWLWMVAVSSATHLDCVQQNGHNCGSAEISTSRGYFLFINAYRLEHCTRTNFISCYLELMCTPFPYIFSDMYSNGIVGETQYIEITCIIQVVITQPECWCDIQRFNESILVSRKLGETFSRYY